VVGFCELESESSVYVKGGKFLKQLSVFRLLSFLEVRGL
jgi:hypothetical protein